MTFPSLPGYGNPDDGMCVECRLRPALSDARFGGRCYDCAGRPMQVPKSLPPPKKP